jgi:gamma-glutamyltranspeptidase/glutathione hydrolase
MEYRMRRFPACATTAATRFLAGALCAVTCGVAPLALIGCGPARPDGYGGARPAAGRGAYLVAADQPLAGRAGMEILSRGGNAVDAAVAVSFALAVVRPEDCGLGGGGFALYFAPRGAPVVLDFREVAPAGADRSLYVDRQGEPLPDRTTVGPWAVGVPGQVRGALELWRRYGSRRLSLEMVLAPAIALAEQGFPVDRHLHRALVRLAGAFRRRPEYAERFAETYRVFLKPGGVPYEAGEVLTRPDLAATLKAIALGGAEVFYRGEIAQAIVRETGRLGGTLSASDLADYRVRILEPLRGDVKEHTIFTVPPPSSGGAVLLETLNVLAAADEQGVAHFRPHLLAEGMKHAFRDRAVFLGDRSGRVLDAVQRMVSRQRAREILARIDPARTVEVAGDGEAPGDGGTSHFCVVDREGGVVSWTESINLGFGSLITVPGTGVVLNNTMDDFALTLASPNAFGLRQGGENLLRPGSRPLSSMTPVIVYGPDGLRLAAGGSGGPKIISAVMHLLVAVLWEGRDAEAGVDRGRFHHQWSPDVLYVEPSLEPRVLRGLLERGHTLRAYGGAEAGCVQAIEVRGGVLTAVVDRRKLEG